MIPDFLCSAILPDVQIATRRPWWSATGRARAAAIEHPSSPFWIRLSHEPSNFSSELLENSGVTVIP